MSKQLPAKPTSPQPGPEATAAVSPTVRILAGVIPLALLIRGVCIGLAPASSYLADHVDYMAWSARAWESGPFSLYDPRKPGLINVRRIDPQSEKISVGAMPVPHACNYPPLGCYVFWAQGGLWSLLDGDIVESRVPARVAEKFDHPGEVVRSRAVNTTTSRFVNALPNIVADFLLAWGVAALVRALRGSRYGLAEAIAFSITMLAPPIFLDSAFWGQADSWVSAAMVWCMARVLQQRFWSAGVFLGVGLMLKAQAILLMPVLAFVFLAIWLGPQGSIPRALALWRLPLAALLAVVVISAPFSLAARGQPNGSLAWFQRSFVETIGESYPYTTLKAFNVWWLDYAAGGFVPAALDPAKTMLGVNKSLFGKAVLILSILLSGALAARFWNWQPPSWIACAFLVTLAAFLFPTRVHERYIYYCIPFLIAMTFVLKRWIPVLLALLVVGTAELLSFIWLPSFDVSRTPGQPQISSVLFALMAVLSMIYAWASLLPGRGRAAAAATPPAG